MSEQTGATNVELLRCAAALMRERAQAATPGPWRVDVLNDVVADLDDVSWDVADVNVLCPWPSATEGDDAVHIASWDPNVALAVADWLAWCAQYDTFNSRALAVARAYLGADS